MRLATIREQLHQQIDLLPDEILQLIAEFVAFVVARRRKAGPAYSEWREDEWENFSLAQLLREDDDVEYTLEDAQVVFHP